MGKLNVDGTEIQVLQIEEDDYISLTDMVRKIDNRPALIEKWLRNKNTIEFLGIWEEMYNADFNSAAYEEIMLEAGLNRFIMSVKQWVSRTNSKGIVAKAGRYGGTYAYKDIAFEFASWVSPQSIFRYITVNPQDISVKDCYINAVVVHIVFCIYEFHILSVLVL